MGRCKELTAQERYVLVSTGLTSYRRHGEKIVRDATSARRILKYRKGNSKYARIVKAWESLQAALESKRYNDVVYAHYELHHALKYQGTLQLAVLLAEKRVEGKADDEIEAMMVGDAL